MSVNKILKKRRQEAEMNMEVNSSTMQQNGHGEYSPQHTMLSQKQQEIQAKYESYAGYLQSNPSSYQFSSTYLPNSASLHSQIRLPISIFLPPVSYDMDPQPRSIDKIPRCSVCRSYMTYYNTIKKREYECFVCGRQIPLPSDYVVQAQNVEMTQVNYHVLGGQGFYTQPLPQQSIVFIVDLNISSYQSKMLYYMIAAMKQILSKQQFDQTLLFFFTYDDVVHQYDFAGDQVTCRIIDPTITIGDGKRLNSGCTIAAARRNLFQLLDELEEICKNNKKTASNFFQTFTYIFQSVKHTSPKIYIFQTNEAIAGQKFADENFKMNEGENQIYSNKPKSFLDTKNKLMFKKFVTQSLKINLSFSLFVFSKGYKNLKVFGDIAKITGSQMMLYRKDTEQDLLKFYYDFSYLLGTTYYDSVSVEMIISPGWYFNAVYSNSNRGKGHITFNLCKSQPSKRFCVSFLPHQNIQLPYCTLQFITNYIYKKQHFVTVNTCVLPLTSNLQKLYKCQNYPQISATLHKMSLSGARNEEINTLRNKTMNQISLIYKAANQFYKKKLSPQITGVLFSSLGLLKSPHFQLESINNSIIMDTVVCQRNLLQCCGIHEIQNLFSPYLFNLSTMTEQMCGNGEDFIYPETCQLLFEEVRQGMYLLDNGLALYLYISKYCNPQLIMQLFGKEKISRNQILTQNSFVDNTHFSQQVASLIQVCREQKVYGWAPLYVVRYGENSANEKVFYMNFYGEKFEEYRTFKITLNEFLTLLSQQY